MSQLYFGIKIYKIFDKNVVHKMKNENAFKIFQQLIKSMF